MIDEDPSDEATRSLMSLGAGTARALEVALRAAREHKLRQAEQIERDNDAAIRRLAALAAAAEAHFGVVDAEWMRAASASEVADAWHASQEWADLDPTRIGPHADRINAAAADVVGADLRDLVDAGAIDRHDAAQALSEAVESRARETEAAGTADAAQSVAREAAHRRDRLAAAGVPPAAIEARLSADKLSGAAAHLGTPAAAAGADAAAPGVRRGARRSAAKVRVPVAAQSRRPGLER